MPRKPFISQAQFPYHVTNRCNNKEWFAIPMLIVWRVFCDQMSDSADRFSVHVHSLVVMSNHFHLMVTTPKGNLDAFLRHFLTEVARALQRCSRRINHIFGGRSSQSVLRTPASIAYVYKYVYRNPVRAGLSIKAEEYPFSTLTHLLEGDCPIPVVDGIGGDWACIPREPDQLLNWLNMPTPKELEALIGRGLRRGFFQFSQSNQMIRPLQKLGRAYAVLPDDPYLLGLKGE